MATEKPRSLVSYDKVIDLKSKNLNSKSIPVALFAGIEDLVTQLEDVDLIY